MERKKTRTINALLQDGYPEDYARALVAKRYEYSSVWKYNQLVGILQLTAKRGSLYFNLYCNTGLKPRIDMIACSRFHNCFLIDVKTAVPPEETDEELVAHIQDIIRNIWVYNPLTLFDSGIEKYYFDCEALKISISAEKVRNALSLTSELKTSNSEAK